MMQEIWITSSKDGTQQPSLFHAAEEGNRPLLVGLHTWSFDRSNQAKNLLPLAEKNGWNLLLPEFRGCNLKRNPNCRDACGSEKAKQDIMDAIHYVEENFSIDSNKILLLGASGGGHMALLMAAYAPELFRVVGSFVPITDLNKWYAENPKYREAIEACCGGEPGEETKSEYRYRSPMTYIPDIAKATVKIFSGKWDRVVPCHHGLDLYCKIFEQHPDANVYFEMFDGGHEMPLEMAERWLISQMDDATNKQEQVTG